MNWRQRFGLPLLLPLIVVTFALSNALQAGPPYLPSPYAPDECRILVRDPAELPQHQHPYARQPRTVSNSQEGKEQEPLSLDGALRTALQNSEVIRILAGVGAASSGRTIYDVAISATGIDNAKSAFDPNLNLRNDFLRNETPAAIFNPVDPTTALITGSRTDQYAFDGSVNQTLRNGGRASVNVNANPTRFKPALGALNPSSRSSLSLSYVHPLWRDSGINVNTAPIVIARIDTERSFFQYKDSVQELTRGVINAYWNLVFARTDLWARDQQVQQSVWAMQQAEARLRAGLGDAGAVSQARLALANFRATRIGARANVLNQEAALRNILGLPADAPLPLVPTTPPSTQRYEPEWLKLLSLAELNRPDIIELKLVLEADQQRLLLSKNEVLPRMDASLLYRWNGLEGWMPNNQRIRSGSGQFTDWTMGVNFSVPIGFRAARANLRQQELVLARDRANIAQQMHAIQHTLATNVRNLAQDYEQYLAARETRVAATENLRLQSARFQRGFGIFLDVLQAITEWGNSVSSESRSLITYNNDLANLERQSGTILETHGIHFYEERDKSIGPLFLRHEGLLYSAALPVTQPQQIRYERGERPSEEFFNLQKPVPLLDSPRLRDQLPPPLTPDGRPDVDPNLPPPVRRPGQLPPGVLPPRNPNQERPPQRPPASDTRPGENKPGVPGVPRLPIPLPEMPRGLPDLNRPDGQARVPNVRQPSTRGPAATLLPPAFLASEPTRVIR